MAEEIDVRILTLPLYELDEHPGEYPSVATVREIDAEVINNRISFFFSRGTYLVDLTHYSGGFDGLLRDIQSPGFHYENDTSNRPDPPETPLSLNNAYLSYVVYKLSSKNWQFSHDYPPFTIGKQGKDAKVYYEARRVSPSGNKEKVDIDKRTPVAENCMIAYFIADGVKAKGFTGLYTHAINVHVDLVYDERERAYVPLVIDPDVRYPGGSGS